MRRFDLIATSTFGLENVVARELQALGYQDCRVLDGRVHFSGDVRDIARSNLWLRTADRILIRVGEFPAPDFGALFDQIALLPWSELLPVDAKFPVTGRSLRSRLHAVPRVQAVSKKAIVEALKKTHNRFRFDESGAEFAIDVSLNRDIATITMDTTGVGLHKRGYREVVGAAPLRETMAAGLIQLSYWNPDRPLLDPFCGSGTIPIEAALIGRNIAPGLSRSFAAEDWNWFDRSIWKDVRTEARDLRKRDMTGPILASDHDPQAIRLAQRGATDAGVAGSIRFSCQEVSELRSNLKYGCVITNPPYGERLGTDEEVKAVYRVMGSVFARLDSWGVYVLTSHRGFERNYGQKALRRRKLYNGRLECQFYQYPGPRPPVDQSDPNSPQTQSEAESPKQEVSVAETEARTDSAPTLIPSDPFATFVADCAVVQDRLMVDVTPSLKDTTKTSGKSKS
ncbi:MAG: class I SAM-dependent RNA methyltransferase [Planctomycetaceae bacterium]|nr:class I SAM-dependent RNA methyltransferase [Planctomycetaceae bacterium]